MRQCHPVPARRAVCVLLVGVVVLGSAGAAGAASGQPTTAPGQPVPEDTIQAIQNQFTPAKPPTSRTEALEMLVNQMEQAISLGKAAENWYPDAPNLHVVRNLMLSAALELLARQPSEDRHQQVVDIARRIMDSPAPAPEKLQADFFLVRDRILQGRPETGAEMPPPPTPAELKANRAEIADFLKRYEGTSALAKSIAHAVILADLARIDDLREALLDRLEKDYSDDEELAPFLQHYGRGKFSATLTRIDGQEITVPDDVDAKVIVIDFWATWCGPCVAEAPRMKRIYDKFHPRGVEFVGISLDKNPWAKDKVRRFAKRHDLNWIHTASGKGWEDPTARKYNVRAIPALWVIDRTGRIISDSARGNLEEILEQALSAPAASQSAP